MSLHQTKFYSNILKVLTTVEVILPEPKNAFNEVTEQNINTPKVPVVWLLHGLSDDESAWIRYSSIERYANDYGYAIIMPRVERSFYTDMVCGPAYWSFLTNELFERMQYFYPISADRKDNLVAGLSMGGYGALKYAFNYPERFAGVGAFSPVVDIANFKYNDLVKKSDWGLIFGNHSIKNTKNDIKWLMSVDNPKKNKVNDLLVYTSAGDTDFLLQENLEYKLDFSYRFGKNYCWHQGVGGHEWSLWDTEIQNFFEWIKKNS